MPYRIPNYNPFEKKLTDLQKAVADEYLANGFNKSAAFLKFRPKASLPNSYIWKIFQTPQVAEYINKALATLPEETESLKQVRIKRMEHLSHVAEEKAKLGEAITAHKEVCAMEGHYQNDRSKSDLEQYKALLQQISVTVNVNNSEQKQIINVEAEQAETTAT